MLMYFWEQTNFYPRPPRGGRRGTSPPPLPLQTYFYPRPPRGGRRGTGVHILFTGQFLSTPSARRATGIMIRAYTTEQFLSTPSARRATYNKLYNKANKAISIHALREEGDAAYAHWQ